MVGRSGCSVARDGEVPEASFGKETLNARQQRWRTLVAPLPRRWVVAANGGG